MRDADRPRRVGGEGERLQRRTIAPIHVEEEIVEWIRFGDDAAESGDAAFLHGWRDLAVLESGRDVYVGQGDVISIAALVADLQQLAVDDEDGAFRHSREGALDEVGAAVVDNLEHVADGGGAEGYVKGGAS